MASMPFFRIAALRIQTSSVKLMPPRDALSLLERYGKGAGSLAGRADNGTRNGSSASSVTTHGEMDVLKFLERNGPSGCPSQACTSRADQSLSRHTPQMWL